jgi:hypothetical protein
VTLVGPSELQGILLEDVDGDGLKDVLLLQERRIWIYPGRREALPERTARWTLDLPPDVSFVDAAPASEEDGRGLLVLGREGLRRLPLDGSAEVPVAVGDAGAALAWVDREKASFADLEGGGRFLIPTATGWRFLGGPFGRQRTELEVPFHRELEAPGGFLQDTGRVIIARPEVWVNHGPPRGAAPDSDFVLWTLTGRELVAHWGGSRMRYDASFLPATGDRLLRDLDDDGAPEVIHRDGTNQESTFAFFRPASPSLDEGRLPPRGPSLRPPAVVLRLSGYVLDPDYVDLDGDGRLDFVVTTIAIDGRNTFRALGGKVTAATRAFLNRSRSGDGPLFPQIPDADVASDIGVAIRFSPAGNIDVTRSFTILTTGDFDGDGLKELAIRNGPDSLLVRRGTKDGVWQTEGREIAIPPLGDSPDLEGYPVDLSGDGTDELVLHYTRAHGGEDRVVVMTP